jgi:imidazole glycerol-phosphate synthase subunit HisH
VKAPGAELSSLSQHGFILHNIEMSRDSVITIVDYGIGNLGSVLNMFRKVGVEAERSSDPEAVARADKLVLPGVGSFDRAMVTLRERGMIEALDEAVRRRGVQVLGVCLGMQLMVEGSAEGEQSGLGWIAGHAERFTFVDEPARRVPHMGWAGVERSGDCVLFENLGPDTRFYFVHSFHVVCADPTDVAATARYGRTFAASIARDNMMGVQFHPEKSHGFGMQLLRNFSRI